MDDLVLKEKINKNSYLYFVDDGSEDDTWKILNSFSEKSSNIKGLKLSKNEGHQIALLAGMEFVKDKCDCLISIDADLQDDISVIEVMVDKFLNCCEVVYGVRNDRSSDNLFKRIPAKYFYKFMAFIGVKIIDNHADYRLLSNKANNEILKFKETNLFLRVLVLLIGFKSEKVYYERKKGFARKSKYSFKKMLTLAIDGITSFSIVPLRFITLLGFFVFFVSLIMIGYTLWLGLFSNKIVPGWDSTLLLIYFIGGIQVLAIGIVGEYIGKIYKETKRRPRYFVDKEL